LHDPDDHGLDQEKLETRHDAILATSSAMMRMMMTFQAEFEKFTSGILSLASRGDYQTCALNTLILVSNVETFVTAIDHKFACQCSQRTLNKVIADHELDKGEAEAIYEECKSLSALVERLSQGNNASQSVQNLAVVTRRTKKVAHTLKRLIGVSLRAAILQPGLPDVFPSSLPAGRLTMNLTTY
jgi:hypothetical protein